MTLLPLARALTCFPMFVYIRALFRFALIGGNLTAQSTGSHRGIGGGLRDVVESSPSFSRPAAKAPVLAPLAGYVKKKQMNVRILNRVEV